MAEPCKRPASPPHPEAPITQRAKAEERLAGGPAAAWPPPGLPSWVDRRRHPLAAAPFPCPACGLETLTEECGGFEICGACFWEDDGMWDKPNSLAGPNNCMTLNQARLSFAALHRQHGDALLEVDPPDVFRMMELWCEEQGVHADRAATLAAEHPHAALSSAGGEGEAQRSCCAGPAR